MAVMSEQPPVPYGRKTQRPSPVEGDSHSLDHCRSGLRRRFGFHHRRHATQHRGCAARRDSRACPKCICTIRCWPTRTAMSSCTSGTRPKLGGSIHSCWSSKDRSPTKKSRRKDTGPPSAPIRQTGQPITTCEWIDRLAPKALAVVACGTCATYRRHPCHAG